VCLAAALLGAAGSVARATRPKAGGAARAAHPKYKDCSQFLTLKQIQMIVAPAIVLTKPQKGVEIGAWYYGPRWECGADWGLDAIGHTTNPWAPFPILPALWGVAYGGTLKEWRLVNEEEYSAPLEGTGPWTHHSVNLHLRGYSSFEVTTTSGVPSGTPPISYLYVFTPHHDFLWLSVESAPLATNVKLARSILVIRPGF